MRTAGMNLALDCQLTVRRINRTSSGNCVLSLHAVVSELEKRFGNGTSGPAPSFYSGLETG